MKRKPTTFKSKRSISPPYSSQPHAASHLFERTPAQDYIDEWTHALMEPPSLEREKGILSVMVFRLGKEWLALPTVCFKEVISRRPIHRIPHQNNKILLGIINLNGELKLYIALDRILEIEPIPESTSRIPYQQDRMIAISKEGELWVFSVEEIEGIYNLDLALIENVPVNISKSTTAYIKGIIKIGDKSVGVLDEDLLFSSLKRSIL